MDFHWKANKSYAVDELEKSKLLEAMHDLQELENKKTAKMEYMNVIDTEGHTRIMDRTFNEVAKELDGDVSFPFKSNVFSIFPMVTRYSLKVHSIAYRFALNGYSINKIFI